MVVSRRKNRRKAKSNHLNQATDAEGIYKVEAKFDDSCNVEWGNKNLSKKWFYSKLIVPAYPISEIERIREFRRRGEIHEPKDILHYDPILIVLYPGGFSENGMIIKEKIFTDSDLRGFYRADEITLDDLKIDVELF